MIDFACPECDAPMSVPDSLAGQSQTCPECGAEVAVPAPEVPLAEVVEDELVQLDEPAVAVISPLPPARGLDLKRRLRLAALWLVPVLYSLHAVQVIIVLGMDHAKAAAGSPYVLIALALVAGTWLCQAGKVSLAAIYACCAALQYVVAAYLMADVDISGEINDVFIGFHVAMMFATLALACGIRPLRALAAKLGTRMRSPVRRVLRIVLIVVAFSLMCAGLVIYAIEKPKPRPLGPPVGPMTVVRRTSSTEEFTNEAIDEAKDWAEICLNPIGWSAWTREGATQDTIRYWRRQIKRRGDTSLAVVLIAGRAMGIVLLLAFAIFLINAKPPSPPTDSPASPGRG